MIDLSTVATILVAVAPALSAIITIIGGIIAISKKAKNTIDLTKLNAEAKITQQAKDIALIKSKLTSIENYLNKDKK